DPGRGRRGKAGVMSAIDPGPCRLEDMTEPELRRLCHMEGQAVEQVAAALGVEKPLFVLLLFNDPKIAQYVCNCRREEVIRAMRECALRLEGRQDVPRSEGKPRP